MKVITSHQNLDFDGLASMVACSKLYPEGVIFLAGKVNQEVKRFLGLYKNILKVQHANKVNLDEVTELMIVDVNQAARIGKFAALVEKDIPITIYDHHMQGPSTIAKAQKHIKPYGSCTAILLEEIIKRQIAITPFEATLFLIGIYTDTNCLSYSSTKFQDAQAVAFLLKNGGDLEVAMDFVQSALDDEQEDLFSKLLLRGETLTINGYKIIISSYTSNEYVSELGYIASKIINFKNVEGIFLIVKMEDRCYIVGRSREESINIPYILEEFKGAGHVNAASATVKQGEPEEIKNRLLSILEKKISPQIKAKDIMNYPVKTVFEHMTVEEVHRIMLRYGHTGMPVVRDNKLIGIISRTDIDKGMIHGLGHSPIKGFMTTNVKTIEPSTSLNEINTLFAKHNIGRLPVMEEGRILGIVTRTDLLKIIHGENYPYWYKETFTPSDDVIDCSEKLRKLPQEKYGLLQLAGEVADGLDKKVYVVGGFVRDLILGKENTDIDFVIEGNGIAFAEALNKQLNGKLVAHEQFGTAVIHLDEENTIDIVTARREYYEYPAALPKVEASTIRNDLFRRDFTINCMAIQLNQRCFGRLIDYFGGYQDLVNGQIRVLYNLSFIEDPTRIFRAIRFASRLNFIVEKETEHFMEEALSDNMITKLSDDRICDEMNLILGDQHPHRSLTYMNEMGLFQKIHPMLHITNKTIDNIVNIQRVIHQEFKLKERIDQLLLRVMHILSELPQGEIASVLGRFIKSKSQIIEVARAFESKEEVFMLLQQEDLDKFVLYNKLRSYSMETILFYYGISNNHYIRHYLVNYVTKIRHIRLNITGKDLLALNIQPGPVYSTIMSEILKAKVQGYIYDQADEKRYLQKLYEARKGDA